MNNRIWGKKESQHFVFYFFPDSYASEIIERLIDERELAHRKLNEIFQVELFEKIRWYFFPSREEGVDLLGGASPSQAIPVALTIFTVYGKVEGKVYDSTPGHELTHILSFYWDGLNRLSPYRFLSEGLARYLDQTKRDNHSLAQELKKQNKLIRFEDILSLQDFVDHDPYIVYVQSASFVQFLIESHSWEKFKQLWKVENDIDQHMVEILKKSLLDLQIEWMEKW
jgi:hypothetical protein